MRRTLIFVLGALWPALALAWGMWVDLGGRRGASLEVRTEPLALHGSRLAPGTGLVQELEVGRGALDEIEIGMVRAGDADSAQVFALELEIAARAAEGTWLSLWKSSEWTARAEEIGHDASGVWITARPELGTLPLGSRLRLTVRAAALSNLAPLLRFEGLLVPGPGGSWGDVTIGESRISLDYRSFHRDLHGFAIPVLELPACTLDFELFETDGETRVPVRSGRVELAHATRTGHLPLGFEPLADSERKEFRLELTASAPGRWIGKGGPDGARLGFVALHRGELPSGTRRRGPLGGGMHGAVIAGGVDGLDLVIRARGDDVPWSGALEALPWKRILPAWVLWVALWCAFLFGLPAPGAAALEGEGPPGSEGDVRA